MCVDASAGSEQKRYFFIRVCASLMMFTFLSVSVMTTRAGR